MAHKIGLALGGGGARGSFQIGAIKTLMDSGILNQISVVSGTSIGAIHSLMVMAGISYERMYELWTTIDSSLIFKESRFKLDKLGLFSIQDLYETFANAVTIEEVRKSKIKGFATAAKISKKTLLDQVLINRMEKVVFDLSAMDDPHQAALASASIPIVFGPDDINDETYVDGGTVDNVPIQPLIDQGCDIIIVIPIAGNVKPKTFHDHDITIINICQYSVFDFIGLDIMDFNIDKVPMRVEYGVRLANRMIDKLDQLGIYDVETKTWHIKDEFQYVELTRAEEKEIVRETKEALND